MKIKLSFTPEDPRKIGLRKGLLQLNSNQLDRVISYCGEMVLDHYNYNDGKFCPLAIAVELDRTMVNPTNEKVAKTLEELGYKVNNTRGVKGEFYTTNRKEDLLTLAKEVRVFVKHIEQLKKDSIIELDNQLIGD